MTADLRSFLEIPYDKLEEMNLAAKQQRLDRVSPGKIQEERMKYLTDEKRIKAVTVCFTDLEGRFHMLDYDKKFLLSSADNLTFDGSSIRGFSRQQESDLRLPVDALRLFIDTSAEVQRAMGFANEKDHPEVAPSQFEMNYGYSEAVIAADQVQLYKLLSRQVAARMDMTACFLPKPMTGINGNGMHTNVSVGRKGKNLFWDEKGQDQLSQAGWDFIKRILSNGAEICLLLNSSVNSYR